MTHLFIPLALAAIAAVFLAVVGHRLRPRDGVFLTTASLVALCFASLVSVWALSLGFLANEPITGRFLAWSDSSFGIRHRMPLWVGLCALALTAWSTARAVCVVRSWRRQRGSTSSDTHIIDSTELVAFAQTGRHGGVVISTGMLAVLEPAERRALLAHEHAHLRLRHDRYLLVGQLSAGVPPLTPLVARMRHFMERWADEEAARMVGDRTVVARAIARAALASHGQPVIALGAIGADVPARVEALLRPPIVGRQAALSATFATTAVIVVVVAATEQMHHLAAVLAAICPG